MPKELWEEWEREVAERTGGDLVKASGRLDYAKGDVKTGGFLIDAKDTETDGYPVTADFWGKLASWARNEGREPCIAVRIEDAVNDPFDIAVVSEIWYCEKHPSFEPERQLKKQRQRKLTRKAAGKKPTSLLVGRHRLVAYSFDAWLEDIGNE